MEILTFDPLNRCQNPNPRRADPPICAIGFPNADNAPIAVRRDTPATL